MSAALAKMAEDQNSPSTSSSADTQRQRGACRGHDDRRASGGRIRQRGWELALHHYPDGDFGDLDHTECDRLDAPFGIRTRLSC